MSSLWKSEANKLLLNRFRIESNYLKEGKKKRESSLRFTVKVSLWEWKDTRAREAESNPNEKSRLLATRDFRIQTEKRSKLRGPPSCQQASLLLEILCFGVPDSLVEVPATSLKERYKQNNTWCILTHANLSSYCLVNMLDTTVYYIQLHWRVMPCHHAFVYSTRSNGKIPSRATIQDHDCL